MLNRVLTKKVLLAVTILVSTAAGAQTVISWAKVNATLADIAVKVKEQTPFLTSFDINFDPASDLGTDTLKMNFVAGTDKAVWEGGQAVLDTSLNLVGAALVGEQRNISGNVAMALSTKVVPALQHLLKEPVAECAKAQEVSDDVSGIANLALCGFFNELGKAKTVSDLRVAAFGNLADYKSNLTAYIAKKQKEMANEADAAKKAELQYEVEKALQAEANIQLLSLTGSGDELALRYVFVWNAGVEITFNFDVLVKNDVTSGSIGLATSMKETDYQDFKAEIVRYLEAIEQKNADAVQSIEEMAAGYAQMIGEFITK